MPTKKQSQPTVFVIDDDSSFRDSLSQLFRSVGLEVETFASAAEFLQQKGTDGLCCLVVDVRMPGLSGLDFQNELKKQDREIPIIFMTGHPDIPMTVQAMKAGAVEFLPKPFRDQTMLDAVRAGLELDGKRRLDAANIGKWKSHFASLTPREREVMGLVTMGLINKQIADNIGITEITVKVHRANLMKKMEARTLVDLVRMADALGLQATAN